MTRPIKFRAKILEGYGWKHHEKWVYGFLFKGPLTMENGPASHFGDVYPQWCISTDSGVVWVIDIETVGQFTGLLDKNGKEIYEGDILVYRKIISTIRRQSKKTGAWYEKKINPPKEELHYWEVFFSSNGQWCMRRNGTMQSLCGNNDRHEFIGNLYENPSLLSA